MSPSIREGRPPDRTRSAGGARAVVAVGDASLADTVAQALAPEWRVEPVAPPGAAALLREGSPDLLVVDAGRGGHDAVRALRAHEHGAGVPVIAVGGEVEEGEGDLALEPDERLDASDVPRRLARRAAAHLALSRARGKALARARAARGEAVAAARAKDEFIAMISHELRTPLGAILIWAQLLKTEEVDAPTLARAVRMIERSSRSLTQLIDDLLDASRIIAGKLTFEKRPMDLTVAVEAAADAAERAAEGKNVAVGRDVASGLPPVSGDTTRLQQVVVNLISNAIKFTPEGGRVDVRLWRAGNVARVEVSDTGAGIALEFLPHIFEKFRQADATTTRRQKGLGLGLAIARHIVELHGGTIEASSPGRDQGSTFRVTLPLQVGLPVPEAQAADEGRHLSLHGVRVLLVDDEVDAREATAVLLSQAGARVVSAGSCSEAVDAMASRRPDVLLSDIAMPGEDGYELIRRVRAFSADGGGRIPAAALTAYATLDDRAAALRAGYDEHIPKPVDPERLVRAVARLAGRTGG